MMLRDADPRSWHDPYFGFEQDLRQYRDAQKMDWRKRIEKYGRGGYKPLDDLVDAIDSATKLHPEWKKYAEKQMSSEQPIEEFGLSLERKIYKNSWSSLFNKYTTRFYDWYKK